MPYGDRTGPRGIGPKTGRGAGYCAGYPFPGFMNPYFPRRGGGRGFGRGRGWGRGCGRGRGWGRGYPGPYYDPMPHYESSPGYGGPYQEPAPEEEKAYLEKVVESLENDLKEVKKRIQELAKEVKK